MHVCVLKTIYGNIKLPRRGNLSLNKSFQCKVGNRIRSFVITDQEPLRLDREPFYHKELHYIALREEDWSRFKGVFPRRTCRENKSS